MGNALNCTTMGGLDSGRHTRGRGRIENSFAEHDLGRDCCSKVTEKVRLDWKSDVEVIFWIEQTLRVAPPYSCTVDVRTDGKILAVGGLGDALFHFLRAWSGPGYILPDHGDHREWDTDFRKIVPSAIDRRWRRHREEGKQISGPSTGSST